MSAPTMPETDAQRIVRLALQEKNRLAEQVGELVDLPLGTGGTYWSTMAAAYYSEAARAADAGVLSHRHLQLVASYAAWAQDDPVTFVQAALQVIGLWVAAVEHVVSEQGSGVLPPPF